MPFYSPVRLSPAVGVTSGAHYRMSAGHSSPPKLRSHDAAHTTDTRSLHMCGLCPSVEWQCCNFEGTDLVALAHLEATATLRSPYTSIFSLKINFRLKCLYMFVFFCTFVVAN